MKSLCFSEKSTCDLGLIYLFLLSTVFSRVRSDFVLLTCYRYRKCRTASYGSATVTGAVRWLRRTTTWAMSACCSTAHPSSTPSCRRASTSDTPTSVACSELVSRCVVLCSRVWLFFIPPITTELFMSYSTSCESESCKPCPLVLVATFIPSYIFLIGLPHKSLSYSR